VTKSQSSGAELKAPLFSGAEGRPGDWMRAILFAVVVTAGLGFTLALPSVLRPTSMSVGVPSPRDIAATLRVSYTSRLLTEAEQQRAAASVEPVYRLDADVARQQLTRVRQVLAYVSSIREDQSSSVEDKSRWLSRISDLVLPTSVISDVLTMDEAPWRGVSTETVYLLDNLMREGVREDRLAHIQSQVPQLVSYTLSADEAKVAAAFVGSLLKVNSFFDESATEEARARARDEVEPVTNVIEAGEPVIHKGEIVSPYHLEQFVALGLQSSPDFGPGMAGRLILVATLAVCLSLYLWQSHRQLLGHKGRLSLLALLIVVSGVGAELMIPGHVLLPYFFPLAAIAMLVSVLFDTRLAIVVTVALSLFVGLVAGSSLAFTAYAALGSLVAAVAVSRPERIATFAWAAIGIAVVNSLVAGSFRLLTGAYDITGMLQVAGASVANGVISSSLTFTTFFWLGSLFGITTPLQLFELSRPTHPLSRRLLLEAPGTYHHSLIVGNLGERAAEVTGADPLLVRVAALHHDVGKVLRPYFFVENQAVGENYHEQLDAKTSAQIIISHVKDSLDLAKKHRFPSSVMDIIAQHHGTTSVGFGSFFQQASRESGGDVDEAEFRYPGPRPRTKEAAIVMLADSVEAAVRASAPETSGEMERIVRKITNDRLVSGQLDECDVTLRDLDLVRGAFIDVLQGVFHPRLQYPERDSLNQVQ